MNPTSEQRTLKLSILVTALIGVGGIAAGFMIGSRAIMFDGMYSFVDVLTTSVALTVSNCCCKSQPDVFSSAIGIWNLWL